MKFLCNVGSKLLGFFIFGVIDVGFLLLHGKGNYYHYLAKFKIGNERKVATDQSLNAYQVEILV